MACVATLAPPVVVVKLCDHTHNYLRVSPLECSGTGMRCEKLDRKYQQLEVSVQTWLLRGTNRSLSCPRGGTCSKIKDTHVITHLHSHLFISLFSSLLGLQNIIPFRLHSEGILGASGSCGTVLWQRLLWTSPATNSWIFNRTLGSRFGGTIPHSLLKMSHEVQGFGLGGA